MNDLTRDSDRLLGEGHALLRDNREGGRHRRVGSIGEASASLKRSHFKKKIARILLAVAGVWIAASVIGVIINGIGFTGVMLTALATAAALFAFGKYPGLKVPGRADLMKGDVRQMVGRTEIWLEHQTAALPPPAVRIVEGMGVQLDALGRQLETVDPAHPASAEIRKLVGEVLPETIDAYRSIPAHLRGEKRAGATPDEQLTDSLGKISREIDSVTRQLAEGSLDDLAIKTRYLDYRYGDGDEGAGVPLPDFAAEKSARDPA